MTPQEPAVSHQWMSELPTKCPTSKLHWVPTGTDWSGWRQAPIGSWVPICDDTLPVGPLWDECEENEALRDRKRCPDCVDRYGRGAHLIVVHREQR
jgi:hypothetical protein